MLNALDVVVGRFQIFVGNEHHRDFEAVFQLGNIGSLLIEQEGGHLYGHLHVERGRAFFHGLFLQDTQNVQRAGIDIANYASAITARAGNVRAFIQGRAQTLAR